MPRKARCMLEGLAQAWDVCEASRKHLRAEQCVLSYGENATFHATVKTCAECHAQIIPVLESTRETLIWICCLKLWVCKLISTYIFAMHWKAPWMIKKTIHLLHPKPRTLMLPEVAPLMAQLKLFYHMNGLAPSNDTLYRDAWGLKGACGFIKRKGRRQELTKEP